MLVISMEEAIDRDRLTYTKSVDYCNDTLCDFDAAAFSGAVTSDGQAWFDAALAGVAAWASALTVNTDWTVSMPGAYQPSSGSWAYS